MPSKSSSFFHAINQDGDILFGKMIWSQSMFEVTRWVVSPESRKWAQYFSCCWDGKENIMLKVLMVNPVNDGITYDLLIHFPIYILMSSLVRFWELVVVELLRLILILSLRVCRNKQRDIVSWTSVFSMEDVTVTN